MGALATLGLPRDDAAVRDALATRLPHGRHGDMGDDPAAEGRREPTSEVESGS
jgi:hypothetical protein